MDINIKGNPGTGNHLTEVKTGHVKNINPNVKEVKGTFIIGGRKDKDTLVWHPAPDPYPVPSKGGADIQLLLKVEGIPMPYLTATWDGHHLYTFSTFGNPDSPWISFPDSIRIKAWAVLP